MTYQELLEAGRKLSADQRADAVRRLALDPRFSAVVAMLESDLWRMAITNSQPMVSELSGRLAHTAGGFYALNEFTSRLRAIIDADPPRRRAPARPD